MVPRARRVHMVVEPNTMDKHRFEASRPGGSGHGRHISEIARRAECNEGARRRGSVGVLQPHHRPRTTVAERRQSEEHNILSEYHELLYRKKEFCLAPCGLPVTVRPADAERKTSPDVNEFPSSQSKTHRPSGEDGKGKGEKGSVHIRGSSSARATTVSSRKRASHGDKPRRQQEAHGEAWSEEETETISQHPVVVAATGNVSQIRDRLTRQKLRGTGDDVRTVRIGTGSDAPEGKRTFVAKATVKTIEIGGESENERKKAAIDQMFATRLSKMPEITSTGLAGFAEFRTARAGDGDVSKQGIDASERVSAAAAMEATDHDAHGGTSKTGGGVATAEHKDGHSSDSGEADDVDDVWCHQDLAEAAAASAAEVQKAASKEVKRMWGRVPHSKVECIHEIRALESLCVQLQYVMWRRSAIHHVRADHANRRLWALSRAAAATASKEAGSRATVQSLLLESALHGFAYDEQGLADYASVLARGRHATTKRCNKSKHGAHGPKADGVDDGRDKTPLGDEDTDGTLNAPYGLLAQKHMLQAMKSRAAALKRGGRGDAFNDVLASHLSGSSRACLQREDVPSGVQDDVWTWDVLRRTYDDVRTVLWAIVCAVSASTRVGVIFCSCEWGRVVCGAMSVIFFPLCVGLPKCSYESSSIASGER